MLWGNGMGASQETWRFQSNKVINRTKGINEIVDNLWHADRSGYALAVRWDRFFDDLEDQLASEWEAERAALDTEAERLRLSRVTLGERLRGLSGAGPCAFEFVDGTVATGEVCAVGADWVGMSLEATRGAVLAPFTGLLAVSAAQPDLLRSARPDAVAPAGGLAQRMTIGFVLRDLARRRIPVAMHTVGRTFTGTIDRAGADHLDLALHDPGAPRRSAEVRGYRLVPFASIAWIGLEDPSALA
jgi:hypothetical protein